MFAFGAAQMTAIRYCKTVHWQKALWYVLQYFVFRRRLSFLSHYPLSWLPFPFGLQLCGSMYREWRTDLVRLINYQSDNCCPLPVAGFAVAALSHLKIASIQFIRTGIWVAEQVSHPLFKFTLLFLYVCQMIISSLFPKCFTAYVSTTRRKVN